MALVYLGDRGDVVTHIRVDVGEFERVLKGSRGVLVGMMVHKSLPR